MNWNEIIQNVFTLVLIPLLGIVARYLVVFIEAKANELKARTDNAKTREYIDMAKTMVSDAVVATNQTYVDAMKNKQAFDKEAQTEAFNRTLNAVMASLSDDAKSCLTSLTGDLNTYLTTLIEASVKANKQ